MGLLSLGRQGRTYAKLESVYGTAEVLAAANAVRHSSIDLNGDKFNRETLMEKQTGARNTATTRVDRRESAAWSVDAWLRPAGALNTAPEADQFLQAAMGQTTSVTLSTTVASAGSLTGATLTSAGTLAVGDPVLITCPDGKKRVRFLTSVAGAVVGWAPSLPSGQVPANGAAVKGGRRYHLSTALAKSLTIAHYLVKTDGSAGLERQVIGAGVDKMSITLDANAEPMISLSGDAKQYGAAQAKPGGFTTVGGNPPSGIVGEAMIANSAILWLKSKIELTNGLWWRKDEAGVALASEMLRAKRSELSVSLSAHVDDPTVLYDLTVAGTLFGLFNQIGFTEGNIVAFYLPKVELKIPKTSDGDEVVDWDYSGAAFDSTDASNDALTIAFL